MTNWRNVDVRLAVTDAPVGNNPEYVPCPFHQEGARPNFAVYPDGGFCHVCHHRLGRMETLALLLFGSTDKAALDKAFAVAGKYTVAELDAYRKRVDENVKTDPLPWGLATAYQYLLCGGRSNRIPWLTDRGLNFSTIDIYKLGHDGTRFTIPVSDQDYNLLTVRFRRDDQYGVEFFDPRRGADMPIPKYSGLPGRNGLFLYPAPILRTTEWVVIVEGELDALRLIQEGIPAITATNGAGNASKVPALLMKHAPHIKRVFIATDQDEPGRAASLETHYAARQELLPQTQLMWPLEWGKDVTELYQNGHRLEQAGFNGDDDHLPQA